MNDDKLTIFLLVAFFCIGGRLQQDKIQRLEKLAGKVNAGHPIRA